ncbi:MAG: CCA tRNA nucleotidyltransferase [Synechococcus sp.]|nr:CCA tRNA nucleotidyltransferase [Synechococcus sp.]
MATALTLPPDLPGMPPELLPLLVRCSAGCRIALVGGAVRDLLLHRLHHDPWRGVPDLDLVVEGGAGEPAAAPRLARTLAGAPEVRLCDWREHGAYGTVELELELELRPAATTPALTTAARPSAAAERAPTPEPTTTAGQPQLDPHPAAGAAAADSAADSAPVAAAPTAGPAGGSADLIQLDLATARREEYPQAADNPQVRFGRLEDDLARRDFTINAMALLLGDALLLLDPHGGLVDLRHRQLRFLHGDSVRDDPTRLLRAARYAARLGFQLADSSREQARATLAAWPWCWRHGDPPSQAPPALGTRLRMELQLLLEREPWPRALTVLQDWGGLSLLDPALQIDRRWRRRLRWAERLGLERMTALLAATQTATELAERLQLPHRQQRLLLSLQRLRTRLEAPDRDRPRSVVQWCRLLEAPGSCAEAVALALAAGIGPRRPLLRWWLRWRHIRAPLSAGELIAAEGLQPGPALGARLRQLREQRLASEALR